MRCRKAHWYLSARCDGTLSERQRVRLEAHLSSCENCRREAFYFSEIGNLATRMATHSTQPDFDLRLRSAIRRAEYAAAHPVSLPSRMASLFLRPAVAGASVVVLGLAGLGAWSLMTSSESPQAKNEVPTPGVSAEHGIYVGNGQLPGRPGELVPVDGLNEEARRLRARYLDAVRLPQDYVMDAVPLETSTVDSSRPRYVLPTVSPDQVTGKVSY